MSNNNIAKYLERNHPSIFTEVNTKLTSIPCDSQLVQKVLAIVLKRSTETWKVRLLLTSSILLLCSPESIHSDERVRKGVALTISEELDITKQAISAKLEQCRHYYRNNAWTRETVDEIIKEVKEVPSE